MQKYKKRKLRMISLAVSLALCLSACGSGDNANNSETDSISDTTQASSTTETAVNSTEEQVVPDYSDRMIPRADSFDGGDGSEANPFRISTKEQLALLSYRYSQELRDDDYSEYRSYGGQYYVLTEDIYLNDTSDYESWGNHAPEYFWVPIGYFNEKINFDGGGHTIYGMYEDLDYMVKNRRIDSGLFGSLSNSTVKNVNLKQGYIRQGNVENTNNSAYIGGISGEVMESKIENCTVDVYFEVQFCSDIGGICGDSCNSAIRGCTFEGEFRLIQNGKLYASTGGIVGSMGISGQLENCVNRGRFSYINNSEELYKAPRVGGIVSNVNPGLVTDDESSFEIDIQKCVNEMDMDLGNGHGAGIASDISIDCSNASVLIDSCENKANIISSSSEYGVGGLIYSASCNTERNGNHSLLIKNCSNYGDITAISYAGGIVTKISAEYSGYSIVDCKNTGNITSTLQKDSSSSAAGGIIGFTDVSKKEQMISGCFNEGNISSASGYAGGIIGVYQGFSSGDLGTVSAGCTVKECENSGLIQNESGNNGTGGILGGVISAAPYISIEKCVNSGRIGGLNETCAGGIVGRTDSVYASSEDGGVKISNCVNYGTLFVGSSTELITKEGERKKREAYSDVDDSYKTMTVYFSVNTGSNLGGLIGRTRGAMVENSVSAGSFETDDNYMVLDTTEEYLFHSKVNELHPDEKKALFVGGVAGGKQKGTDDNTGTLIVRGCYYADTCYRSVIDDNEYNNETMYDAKRLSPEEADDKAKDVLGD